METVTFEKSDDWFMECVEQARGEDRLPDFTPVISHSDFLRRHEFARWLHDLRILVEIPNAAEAWREAVRQRRIERKVRHARVVHG